MPPEVAAFPRLQKIKVILDKHNNLIFEAERERNNLEIELIDLKGFATVQNFCTAFYTAQRATDAYQKECVKRDEAYEETATPKAETMHEKILRYQEKADRQNASQPFQSRNNGAK